jgi:hypothetical protein
MGRNGYRAAYSAADGRIKEIQDGCDVKNEGAPPAAPQAPERRALLSATRLGMWSAGVLVPRKNTSPTPVEIASVAIEFKVEWFDLFYKIDLISNRSG